MIGVSITLARLLETLVQKEPSWDGGNVWCQGVSRTFSASCSWNPNLTALSSSILLCLATTFQVVTLLVNARQSISTIMGVRFTRGMDSVSAAFKRRM